MKAQSTSSQSTAGNRLAILLIALVTILSCGWEPRADGAEPTPEAIAGSIGMLRSPEKYPPEFLLMAASKLSQASPGWLPTILLNMEDCDYAATNWLKWAGDEIVERNIQQPESFPLDSLSKVCDDLEIPASIREISTGWLAHLSNFVRAGPRDFTAFKFVSSPVLSQSVSKNEMRSYWSSQYGIRWKLSLLGASLASPFVANDCVLSLTQPTRSPDLMVSCHDESTGILRWSRLLNVPSSVAEQIPALNRSPSFQIVQARDEEIVVLHDIYGIAAFSTAGELRWVRSLQNDLKKLPQEALKDLELVLVATGAEVFLQIRGVDHAMLVCLDAEDGQIKWRRNDPSSKPIPPVLVSHKSGPTLVHFAANQITGLSPDDGAVRWAIDEPDLMSCTGREPGTSRIQYECARREKRSLQVLDLESCGPMTSELHTDLQNVRQLFAFNHQLLELTPENVLICIDGNESNPRWTFPMNGDVLWPPTPSGELLYVTNRQGRTLILSGRTSLFIKGTGDLNESVEYAPVPGKNSLLVQTQTYLICVQPPENARSP